MIHSTEGEGMRASTESVSPPRDSVNTRVRGSGMRNLLEPTVEVEEMSANASRAMFNAQTRDKLGISGDEFLRHLDAGEYQNTEDENILRLVMLAPFGR